MTAVPLQAPYAYFTDGDGNPLAGGKIYTYAAGTTTNKATYTDYTATVQAANPIILDAAGKAAIWIEGSYRFDVKTSADVLVRSVDNVSSFIVVSTAPKQIQPISASVASNAMTISLDATTLDFRSTTLGDGTITQVTSTIAASVIIPSTATLGTVNAQLSRIAVLALNNGGTIELAVVNMSGGVNLKEEGLISTTAIAAASNSATTVYSTTARTNLAYRLVGFVESTQATAGTWATAPSLISGAGGNVGNSMSSIGYGQTWQSVTRNSGTTYYNTTGKPIHLVATTGTTSVVTAQIDINGVNSGSYATAANTSGILSSIIPPFNSYVITVSAGTINARELR